MEEHMHKTMKTAAAVLIAVAALLAAYQYRVSVGMTYPTKTFSVDGTGDVDTTPDLATFSVTVTTDGGKNVVEVQSANAEKMNRVDAFLKDQGVAKEDLKTLQYNLSPRYTYTPCSPTGACPAPAIAGYNLTQTLRVKVRDNAKLGDLLSGVVANGANSVSDVSFVVDDDSSAKDAAREKAIVDAQKKAAAIAQAAGFQLGKLVTLYENSAPQPYDGMGGNGGVMAEKATIAPVVDPGTQLTKVQVTLTYEIKN